MGTRSRLALLMVIGVLGSTPPARPPGFNGGPTSVAKCPQCGRESTRKSGTRYQCRIHGWFVPAAPEPEPEQN